MRYLLSRPVEHATTASTSPATNDDRDGVHVEPRRAVSESVEARWRTRQNEALALYAQMAKAYGGKCARCGASAARLVIACIAEDGGRSGAPPLRGYVFMRRLREFGWPRQALFDGRLHRVELRCLGCRKQREYLGKKGK